MDPNEQEPKTSTKVESKSSWRTAVSDLSGMQLALIGAAIVAAVVVLGIIFLGGEDSAPSSSQTAKDLGQAVQAQRQDYVDLLDADASERDAAQQAVEDSPAGMAGYQRFVIEELEAERGALQSARTDGMASPAAVQQLQRNIVKLSAEQARLAAG